MDIYNEQTVKEVIRLCSFGIPKGLGEPVEGKMCIEAIIAKAHGLPHQDRNSECVGEEVAKAKISLNDCSWSSHKARAKGMVAIGIAQLGSNQLDQKVFKERLELNSTKRILSYLIQKHFDHLAVKDETLLEYKKRFENLTKLDDSLWNEFYNKYNNYYYYYYNYYYNYYYYYNNVEDEFLLLIADIILQTLKELKSPGCEYLYLLEDE